MLCYKDKTFCDSDCTQDDCYRYLSEDEERNAKKCGLLVALCDYSVDCKDYVGGREL